MTADGSATPLIDHADRARITGSLDETLFVEAGAGSGKTSSLVDRIVNLVDRGGVPVGRIAAITFTEAAARELRTRVRDALDQRAEAVGHAGLVTAAGQVESAAFTTLHSFALRLLADHPIEAGLPPGFGVVDEITSALEFDESWRLFLGKVGDDMTLLELQERAAAMGIELRQFAGVARRFDDNWDLLDRVHPEPPELSEIDFDDVLAGLAELEPLTELCITPDDKYLTRFELYLDLVRGLRTAEPIDQLQALPQLKPPPRTWGRKTSWREPGIDHVRKQVADFHRRLEERIDRYKAEVMDYFVTLVAGFVAGRVDQRQRKGELAFHDLLVLARRLLRTDETVRQTLHQRYSRILLDEFQDTDPIQIELAVLLASSAPVGTTPWQELTTAVEPGRLTVVGDPKQSIYRFRRADIGVYTETEAALADGRCRLTTNFRTVPGVLEWVNEVFAEAIGEGEPGMQPPYVPLDPARPAAPDGVVPVTVLGGPHDGTTKIHKIRELEGLDVAASVCRIMEEGWLVERDGGWLPARLKDIAVLIPSRLSLPSLESAFAATNVPFRPETNSLVYATQEVRDVLAGVRAVVGPTNSVDVVATLRSALFAVGDDELLDWKLADETWDYRDIPAPERAEHAVAEAFAVLRAWHRDRWWSDPATLIDRIVRERRLREAALAEPRPRDRWRRYRFLAEQAREFAETQGGDLHDFVAWVEVQSSDIARITEPVPAEPDDDAVRVLTVHGAKGLEFPIVILAGAPTADANAPHGPRVIFPPEGRPQVRLRADRQTAEFDVHASMEDMLDSYERIRLHYVAATRARDRLIVSAHHKTTGRTSIGRRTWEAIQGRTDLWQPFERRGDEHYAANPPTQLRLASGGYREEFEEWEAAQSQILTATAAARQWSATGVAEAADSIEPADPSPPPAVPAEAAGPDGGSEQLTLVMTPDPESVAPGVESERGPSRGARLGSAVHAALELLDFDRPDELAALARSAAARHGVADLATEVERRVAAALGSPTIEAARTTPHWRELYVAVPTDDGTLEGFIDLCVELDDGLLIVDYKTDALAGTDTSADTEAAVDERLERYRLQGAAYALALGQVTGRPIVGCRFLFLGSDGVIERDLPDLDAAMAEVRQTVGMSEPS